MERRLTLTALALVSLALPARANKLTAVPKLAGRTARNMVTFHDKQAAIEQWSCLVLNLTDGIVSWNAGRVAPNVHEANPLLGPRPSLAHYSFALGGVGFGQAMITQTAHEWFDGTKWKWETFTPLAFGAAANIYGISATEHTIQTDCRTAGIVCR